MAWRLAKNMSSVKENFSCSGRKIFAGRHRRVFSRGPRASKVCEEGVVSSTHPSKKKNHHLEEPGELRNRSPCFIL